MGMFKGLLRPFNTRGKGANAGVEISPFPVQQTALFDLPRASFKAKTYNNFAAGYGDNVYLYRAVDYIATACAGIKLRLYTDETKKKEINSHPFLDLLKTPHNGTSRVELIKEFVSYSILAGNAYLYAVNVQNKPKQLWSIRPDMIDLSYNDYRQKIYTYNNGSTKQNIDPAQILHLRMFNPSDELYGLSPVSVAAALIEQYNSGTMWNVSLMQNAGRPSGALISQATLGDASYLTLKNQIEEAYTGPAGAGRPLLLDGGLDWKQFSLSPLELDWVKSKENIAREIALAIGVPPELLGDSANKTHANYKESRASFLIETVLPFLDLIMSKLNAWLPILYAEALYIDYDKDDIEALQEDRNAIVERVNKQYQAGYITANEARKATGYDDLNGFDFIVTPDKKMIQAADVTKITAENAKPAPPPQPPMLPGGNNTPADGSQDGNNAGSSNLVNASQGDANTPADAGNIDASQSKALHPIDPKALNLNKDEKGLYWQSFESKREGYYDTVTKAFQGYFKTQEGKVLKALNNAALPETAYAHVAKALANTDDLTKAIAQTYMTVGEDFGKATYASIMQRAGKGMKALQPDPQQPAFDVWASIVTDWLKLNSSTKIVRINDTTMQDVRDRLAEGTSKGESIQQLADRIRGLYAEYYKNRSQAIARTEVISASNLGAMAGATQTGLPLKKEWISTRDSRTREAHVEADGQVVPKDAPFIVKDEKLGYPGDFSLGASPDNTIQCRCTVGFIHDEGEEGDTPPDNGNGLDGGKKHLPGKHDQRTHGRRYGSVGGKNAKEGYLHDTKGDYTDKKTVKAAVAFMQEKYPHIEFKFAGTSHIDTVNAVLKQADVLLTRFPDVGKNLKYIGDGNSQDTHFQNSFKKYLKEKGNVANAYAQRWSKMDGSDTFSVIVMNPRIMKDPPYKSELDSYNPKDTKNRWTVDFTQHSMFTHEFGHVIHNYLEWANEQKAITPYVDAVGFGKMGATMEKWTAMHRKRGDAVSKYGATNRKENFAEGFAALVHLPPAKWPQYTWEQKKLLDLAIPKEGKSPLRIKYKEIGDAGLTPRQKSIGKNALRKLRSHLGIAPFVMLPKNEKALIAAMEVKGMGIEHLDDGTTKEVLDDGTVIFTEAPLPAPIDQILKDMAALKPDDSGDATEAEVEEQLANEADSLHDLLHALMDADDASGLEHEEDKAEEDSQPAKQSDLQRELKQLADRARKKLE